ncbi:MAG TPA: diguanylate cyclase, partial [Fibrobacteria bacterium]|nr:diguanylate cyclase [Fibrobacteria bacterium]
EIRASPVTLPGGKLVEISVSAGVALFPSHAGNWQDLWSRADEALYQAKNGGRGRWVLWSAQGKIPLA